MDGRILAVEGTDDQNVLWHILLKYEVEKCFEVKDFKGVDNIINGLPTLAKTTNRLAIIIDADLDLESRWRSVRDRARRIGFDLPEEPELGGCCVENENGDRLGVWLMPNNTIPGMLEDFLRELVPDGDELLPYVEQFIDSLPPVRRRFLDKHKSKAIIRTYLAVQEEPGLPFGTAIKAKYFNSDGPEVIRLIEWINRVLVT